MTFLIPNTMNNKRLFIFETLLLCLNAFGINPSNKMDETPIRIVITNPCGDPDRPRGEETQISASYNDVTKGLTIVTLNAGIYASVTIENSSTGEYFCDSMPGTGSSVFYISGESGCWVVSIHLLSGDIYEGSFLL